MSTAVKWILGILLSIVLIVILFISTVIGTYNSLVKLSETVKGQHSNISVQLERRADLIPNLINTVKGYATHETELFENLAKSRQMLLSAGNIQEQANADIQMSSALGRLFAISEAYPELKANTNFIRLQDELAGTENRIAVARRDYNIATKEYNSAIQVFPGVIIATYFGYEDKAYFEASEGAENVPTVEF